MPKKIFAVTNIKVGQDPSEFFEAGAEVDTSKFTMEQLKTLHDEGAIEVVVVDVEPVQPLKIEDADVVTSVTDEGGEDVSDG